MTTRIDGEPDLGLEIDGVSYDVFTVVGQLGVSRSFRFTASVVELDADARKPEDGLGRPARLTIQPIVGPPLIVHAIVVGWSSWSDAALGGLVSHHDIELAPAVAALEIGQDHRYFQECTVVDAVKKMLAGASIDPSTVSFAAARTYPKRPYIAQWGESDWAFIERIVAEEGIAYRFDFEDDVTKLVFFDDSTSAPDVVGGAVTMIDGGHLASPQEAVAELRVRRTARPDQVVLRDYAPEKPQLSQHVEVDAGATRFPQYDYPGRYAVLEEGKRLARQRLDAQRVSLAVLEGVSTTVRLWPGRLAEIEGSPFSSHARVFITDVLLRVQRQTDDNVSAWQLTFSAIPAAQTYRPPSTSPARLLCPQTAAVVGPSGRELHLDDTGRLRAQFYWDRLGKRDDQSSTFMRVGQFALGGSMVRPRIGWDVLVEHHVGDADAPLLLTHLYDGEHPVPYALPANKTRTSWQTATTPGGGSSNEVRFEDSKGSEEIFFNASKNMNVTIGDTKGKKVGKNHTHDIGAASKITVGTARTIGVKVNQTFEVSASETLTVSGSRSTTISGGETVTIGASRTVSPSSGKTLDADGGRSLTVGGNMMGVSALGVNRAVLGSATVTVGGAWISVAAAGLANITLGAGAETVGGVKLQVGAKAITFSVKGALAETVGAAYVSAAGGNFGETATGALSFVVGGAFIVNSPSIEIEAESEIAIVCGGSSLTIKSGSIELKAPAIPMPAGTIGMSGAKIQHNP